MTWQDVASEPSRVPVQIVEVDLDYVENGPATMTSGALGYKTPHTTDDAGTSGLEVTTKTRRWMSRHVTPVGTLSAVPCVSSISISSEEIRVARGLGFFGQATVSLVDFVDDDREEDPYYDDSSRSGVDHTAGTYFGKLVARTGGYWSGRSIRIIEGWLEDGVYNASNSLTRNYLIRDIQGPVGGRFTITCAGPLQMLNLDQKQAPAPSRAKLTVDITDALTVLPFDSVEDPDSVIPSDGYVRIGDEIIHSSLSMGAWTLTRGQFSTVEDAHTNGDTIQPCLYYGAEDITDILQDLLETQAGIDSSLLDLTGWAIEQDKWLRLYNLTGIVSEPTKVMDLVQELLEISACLLWWDDATGKVTLKALRPALATDHTITDAYHMLGHVTTSRRMEDRVSSLDVLMVMTNGVAQIDEASSYKIRVVGQSLGAGTLEHKSAKIQQIATRWLDRAQTAIAVRASFQTAKQLENGRITYSFDTSAKDAWLQLGDIVDIQSADLIDTEGEVVTTRAMIVKRDIIQVGSKYRYVAEQFVFDGRFAYVTPATVGSLPYPDYANATADQRDPGWFLSDTDGTLPNGDPPYLLG